MCQHSLKIDLVYLYCWICLQQPPDNSNLPRIQSSGCECTIIQFQFRASGWTEAVYRKVWHFRLGHFSLFESHFSFRPKLPSAWSSSDFSIEVALHQLRTLVTHSAGLTLEMLHSPSCGFSAFLDIPGARARRAHLKNKKRQQIEFCLFISATKPQTLNNQHQKPYTFCTDSIFSCDASKTPSARWTISNGFSDCVIFLIHHWQLAAARFLRMVAWRLAVVYCDGLFLRFEKCGAVWYAARSAAFSGACSAARWVNTCNARCAAG